MPTLHEVFSPVFLIRSVIGLIVTAGTAFGIALWVADFVTDKYATGFESAIATLTSEMKGISERIQAETGQLRDEKDALAADISTRIVAAQKEQSDDANRFFSLLAGDLKTLTEQMNESTSELTVSVGNLNNSVIKLETQMASLAVSLQRIEERQ